MQHSRLINKLKKYHLEVIEITDEFGVTKYSCVKSRQRTIREIYWVKRTHETHADVFCVESKGRQRRIENNCFSSIYKYVQWLYWQ